MNETNYRNKNRGYQQLRVWQDAIDFYVLSCRIFRAFPYELNLERKREAGDWVDTLVIKESNVAYG